MSDSIYAPPEADVAVSQSDEADYYVVAPQKFLLLSILTFNLYFVYWFYRNWWIIKQKNGENMWPPMRGLFYIFFTHALFTDVDEKIRSQGRSFDWRPSSMATLFVSLAIIFAILDRAAARNIGSPITDLVATAAVFILPLIIVGAQRAINFACNDPEGSANSTLTMANWVWIVLGALLWLLTLFGVYVLLFEPEMLE